jgi:replicative DNA helicase
LRALIAEGIHRHNVGFVVIDHFRKLDPDRRYQNPLDADEAKVRFLKENICTDLDVAVMCLAHTVKIGEGRDGQARKPRMSDLRGSGMIAAYADQIGLLWSAYKYASEEVRTEMMLSPSDTELLWDKNRFGAPATARLSFIAETMSVLPR